MINAQKLNFVNLTKKLYYDTILMFSIGNNEVKM